MPAAWALFFSALSLWDNKYLSTSKKKSKHPSSWVSYRANDKNIVHNTRFKAPAKTFAMRLWCKDQTVSNSTLHLIVADVPLILPARKRKCTRKIMPQKGWSGSCTGVLSTHTCGSRFAWASESSCGSGKGWYRCLNMAGDLENAPPIEEASLVVGVIRRHVTHTFSRSFFRNSK